VVGRRYAVAVTVGRRGSVTVVERAAERHRSCPFCGASSRLSREHLLPAWLQQILPSDELATHYRVTGANATDRIEWSSLPFRQRSRCVCSGCNNGWMSKLESAAKPELSPLLHHRPTSLGRSAQRVLSAWALKTCLVFQATQGRGALAPRDHFESLRCTGAPPPQVSVWLTSHYRARYGEINSSYVQRPLGLRPPDGRFEEDPNAGYLCFVALGWVGFVVAGHCYASEGHLDYDGHLGDAMLPIWPVHYDTARWPPASMMDPDLVESLARPEGGLSLVLRPSEQHRLA
jgi:hypothetical protein